MKVLEDRPCPDVEVIRLRCMLANGDISESTFLWINGIVDDDREDWWNMSVKERKRFFAIRASENRIAEVLKNNKRRKRK